MVKKLHCSITKRKTISNLITHQLKLVKYIMIKPNTMQLYKNVYIVTDFELVKKAKYKNNYIFKDIICVEKGAMKIYVHLHIPVPVISGSIHKKLLTLVVSRKRKSTEEKQETPSCKPYCIF